MDVTRRIEFDAGHRIPSHKSKCRNLHGHRYVLEATVSGPLVIEPARSDEGMVADFGDLKTLMMEEIHENWDHAFLAWSEDPVAHAAMATDLSLHFVWLNFVPTAENLAAQAFSVLNARIEHDWTGVKLKSVRLYETPNCWADVTREDMGLLE